MKSRRPIRVALGLQMVSCWRSPAVRFSAVCWRHPVSASRGTCSTSSKPSRAMKQANFMRRGWRVWDCRQVVSPYSGRNAPKTSFGRWKKRSNARPSRLSPPNWRRMRLGLISPPRGGWCSQPRQVAASGSCFTCANPRNQVPPQPAGPLLPQPVIRVPTMGPMVGLDRPVSPQL
jgi:hypothetical protein